MNKQEARLQYECVKWFRETYPTYRDNIIMLHNETDKGAYYASLGMVPGASDLMIINGTNVVWTELKIEDSSHEIKRLEKQLKFIKARQWESRFHGGCFISSFDRFKQIVSYFMKKGNIWRDRCMFTVTVMDQIISKAKEKGNKTAKIEIEKHYQ